MSFRLDRNPKQQCWRVKTHNEDGALVFTPPSWVCNSQGYCWWWEIRRFWRGLKVYKYLNFLLPPTFLHFCYCLKLYSRYLKVWGHFLGLRAFWWRVKGAQQSLCFLILYVVSFISMLCFLSSLLLGTLLSFCLLCFDYFFIYSFLLLRCLFLVRIRMDLWLFARNPC